MSSTKPSSSDWEPPSQEELQAMLPQYEITGILGRGGMGAVYRGIQTNLDRTVAIKLLCWNRAERDSLPPGSPAGVSAGAADAKQTFTKGEDELNFVARFRQEAKAMAKLDHPAILSVFDFGETSGGQLYFVMEFVDGMDVHQYLQHHGGKLPQESALSITAHVLDALAYAHSHGIVHRDIKPANILLNHEGRVKIADFGLAKKFGEHADPSTPALTMSHVAVGTPDFVAPEALDGDQVPDHRADLYAVGVMLYQMLTGKLPRGNFRGPSELDAEIDERLDDIVGKAMATDPDHRYQSAAAVRADLDLVLSQPLARVEAGEASGVVAAVVPVTTSLRGKSAPTKSLTKPLLLGLGAAAFVVAGLVVILGGKRGEPESPPTPLTVVAVDKTPALPVPAVAQTPVAPSVKTPDPVANVAKTEPPQAEAKPAGAITPPVAMVEKKPEAPAAPAAKPESPPASAPAAIPAPAPPADPLATLPGLQTRLNGYLTARKTQLTELATKYGRGLDSRLNQAADAGDLKLTSAFDEEKARVVALVASLAAPVTDARVAVSQVHALPELPEGSPETLVILRQTWTGESEKILTALDAALQQSLQALESELTKARDLEKAKAVMAYRESLGEGRADGPSAAASVATTPNAPTSALGGPSALPVNSDLARATKDAPFENSLGMKFVPVPGTDVLFCIHEVRWKDYEEYSKKANETVDGEWKPQSNDGFEIKKDAEEHPVTRVNWEDAQKFCAWLSEKEGKTYRLPTDREWSLAVGIGREEDWKADTTPETVFKVPDVFPWGDEWPPPAGAGNYSDASRQAKAPRDDAKYLEGGYDDTFPTTAPVMSFEANKLGLYDLGGNVWEWCEDWYSVEQKERVLRGGSWSNCERGYLLSSTRSRGTPDFRSINYGFRVVVAVSSDPAPVSSSPPVSRPAPPPMVPDPTLARATKDAPFENSLGMKFVPVPGTEVLFCIHETRYRDYAEYAKKAKERDDGEWKTQTHDGFEIKRGGDDHPVTPVSWDDAQKFCAWLSEKEGRNYRLPTDREWSLAVGIGREEDWKSDTTPATVFKVPDVFPWGDEWPPPQGAGNYSDESRRTKAAPHVDAKFLDGYDDDFPTTAPVMSFEANKLGLFDLGGNVWECCEDWFSDEKKDRVLRGGSWGDSQLASLLSSQRNFAIPERRNNFCGFRVVLEISASSSPPAADPPPAPNPPASPLAASRPSSPDPALARATKDAPFENSLGMKFVPLPRTDVLVCIHQVRHKDYSTFAGETPGLNANWKNQTYEGFIITERLEDHPVTRVSCENAQAFCVWLSQKEGRKYRLPLDKEWSSAVGIGRDEKWEAGTTVSTVNRVPNVFPWGTRWPPPKGSGNFSDESRKAKTTVGNVSWIEDYDDGYPTTAPVMSFQPNNFGLYDLGCNVVEWVGDEVKVGQNSWVGRGASWATHDRARMLASNRLPSFANNHNLDAFGFRVIVEVLSPAE